MSKMQIHLLGRANVVQGSGLLPFAPDKRYQLLSYLAYQADWVGREQLSYLFWSESSSEQARTNLRQLLKRVRDLKWTSGVEAKGDYLRWSVTSDVAAFKESISRSQWAKALEYYAGPLLEGLEGDESPEFLNWLELERDRLFEQWRVAMRRQAEALEREGSWLEAANLLERLLASDDLDEEVLKAYMNIAGREPALKAYQDFAQRLGTELSLTPTSELEQLAKAIREKDVSVLQLRLHFESSLPRMTRVRYYQLSAAPL
jgi:DNA-binding SARP family transcriptional activator